MEKETKESEIIMATDMGNIFVRIGADVKPLQAGISTAVKELEKIGTTASKTSDDLKILADKAMIDNLQRLSGLFGGVSSSILSFGKDLVTAASQAENFRTALITAFQGNQEAADKMLQWAKEFANTTPFETNEIIEATIKLKAYGVQAEQIPKQLQLIGDMASGMGKSMNQAVEAIADARTGELERLKEFGITKKMLDEQMHGALVNAKGQITDMNLLMESLTQIMEQRFAGGMERASKTTAGQISNLRGEVQNLKEALGQELLPTVNETVSGLTKIAQNLNSASTESKSAAVDLLKIGGGLAVLTTGFSMAALKVVEFNAAIQAARMGSLATGGALAVIAAAVLFLGNEYIKHWNRIEQQKSEKIVAETKKIETGFKNVKEAIELVNKTPVEIALDPSLEAKITSLEERIKGIREVAAGNLDAEGKSFSFELASDPTDRNNGMVNSFKMDYTQAMDFLLQKQSELNKKLSETGLPADVMQKYKGQLAEVNLEIKRLYETLEKENPEAFKRQIEQLENSLNVAKTAKNIAEEDKKGREFLDSLTQARQQAEDEQTKIVEESGLKRKEITDKEFSSKLQYYKDDIDHLRSYWNSYKLTYIQQHELTEAITAAKQKQANDEKKILSEREQAEKKTYSTFKATLDNALLANRISQETYYTTIGKYLLVHAEELKNNVDLRLQIEKDYFTAENKLTEEAQKKKSEALKKETEEKEAQKEALQKSLEEEKQAEIKAAEEKQEAEEKRIEATKKIRKEIDSYSQNSYQKELSLIEDTLEEYRQAGVDQVEIEELKHEAIRDLQEETLKDFKQKEEEKRKSIEDTAKSLQTIEAALEANQAKQEALQGSSFNSGSPLMTAEEALSGGKSGHVDPYMERVEQEKLLLEEEKRLQDEKTKLIVEENTLKQELIRIQTEANTATQNFTSALGGAAAALNNIASNTGNTGNSPAGGNNTPSTLTQSEYSTSQPSFSKENFSSIIDTLSSAMKNFSFSSSSSSKANIPEYLTSSGTGNVTNKTEKNSYNSNSQTIINIDSKKLSVDRSTEQKVSNFADSLLQKYS